MGGLGRRMPWTLRFFVVGALALAAIPPLAGFFSKDAVLASAANAGTLGWVLWGLAAFGAFLTALYTFRMVFIVFGREPSPHVQEHLHLERFEGPFAMMWPVATLAVLAVVGGWLQVPGGWNAVDRWLEPAANSIEEASGWTAVFSGAAAFLLAVAGIALASRLYRRVTPAPARLRTRFPLAARTFERKFYFDEAYDLAFYEPAALLATGEGRYVEGPVFLRTLGRIGNGVRALGRRIAAAQTGLVRSYALALAAGLAVIAVVFITVK